MAKLRAVFCDYTDYDRGQYVAICKVLSERYNLNLEFKEYKSGETLIFDMENPGFLEMLDILFVETEMHGMSGVYVANKARRFGYKGLIIFLTNSTKYYEEAFDVGAFNYVLKGRENLKRFETVLAKALRAVKKVRGEYMILNCAGEYRQIEVGDIKYFEIHNHLIDVFYGKEHFEFVSTLGKIENQLLGRGFQRIHRSYLVSLDYVQRISYDEVTLRDGQKIPVGRTYGATLKLAMDAWRKRGEEK